MNRNRSICVLAGGVGAARFVDGLRQVHDPADITVIVNVGDDFEHLSLSISPDLDTLLYTLGGLVHPDQGWGRDGESTIALAAATAFGGDDWFLLGDKDIGLHLVRTTRLKAGRTLSEATSEFTDRLGIEVQLLPATDDKLRTIVETTEGDFDFQTYFVRRQHRDTVTGVRYEGADTARAAPGVLAAIEAAELLIVAPSNPFLSIAPILAVREIDRAVRSFRKPAVGISPLIGGRAVKGPADRLMVGLAGEASPAAIADRYEGFLTHLLIDNADQDGIEALAQRGVRSATADILMHDRDARARVARAALELAATG